MNLGELYQKALAGAIISDLILVSPDEKLGIIPSNEPKNVAGFLFHIMGEETTQLQADITDHFIENNSALQDHIAIRPRIITLSGYIGELNNVPPVALAPLKNAVDRLSPLGGVRPPPLNGLLPSLTANAIRAYNMAEQLYRATEKMILAGYKTSGTIIESRQQEAYDKLYKRFIARQLFYVQTPYGQWPNMAIQSMRITQDDRDKNSSDFTITFKEIRMAETQIERTPLIISDNMPGQTEQLGRIS